MALGLIRPPHSTLHTLDVSLFKKLSKYCDTNGLCYNSEVFPVFAFIPLMASRTRRAEAVSISTVTDVGPRLFLKRKSHNFLSIFMETVCIRYRKISPAQDWVLKSTQSRSHFRPSVVEYYRVHMRSSFAGSGSCLCK